MVDVFICRMSVTESDKCQQAERTRDKLAIIDKPFLGRGLPELYFLGNEWITDMLYTYTKRMQ